MDEFDDAALAIDRCADCGLTLSTDDKIAFPVAQMGAFFHDRGPVVDEGGGGDELDSPFAREAEALRNGRPVRSRLVDCLLRPSLPT